MHGKPRHPGRLAVYLIPLLLAFSCDSPGSYFIVGTKEQKAELSTLFASLDEEPEVGENRFIIISQISRILLAGGQTGKLNLLLTTYVEKNPHDPFNSYYLFLVAQNYRKENAHPLAAHYYERILANHPDLLVQGKSIHLNVLNDLIQQVDQPVQRTKYYKDLLSRFGSHIDQGSTYFYLAKTYERLGEWDQALQAYTRFLHYPDTVIPGHPDAHREVRNMQIFYNSSKNWTMESLDELITILKRAIITRDYRTLERYRAKVNFFAMSWEQEESDANSQVIFDLGIFLRQSKVYYAAEMDIDSNAHEAYLRTWGWSYRIPTWYLYFRKIHFPADPEINGRWEWAGIYFGEKL